MNFEFQLAEINKLGDYDPKWGQKYWGNVSDDLLPISFNSQDQNIVSGSKITAEEKIMKKSAKGTDYWQLKKVKVVGVANDVDRRSASHGSQSQLDRIERKIDKLLGISDDLDNRILDEKGLSRAMEESEISMDDNIGEDPVDIDAIPF